MIITLPISHLITKDNINEFKNIFVYQDRRQTVFKYNGWLSHNELKEYFNKSFCFHDDVGLFDYMFFDKIENVITDGYEFYSTSLSPACLDVKVVDGVYQAQSPLKTEKELFSIAKQRIESFQSYSHYIEFLSLENTAYRENNLAYEHITTPEFISKVINDNEAYFTLDIAHALITAKTMNMNIRSYLHYLPLNKCREIHISKPQGIIDSHDLPDSEVMKLLDFVLSEIPSTNHKDIFLVCEYYKDLNKLKDFYNKEMLYYAD